MRKGGKQIEQSAGAELERERMMTIVNSLSDAVINTDTKGVIRMYNSAALNLLDTNDSLSGHHIDTILSVKNTDNEPVELFKEAQNTNGLTIRDDLVHVFDEDDKVRLEVKISPVKGSYDTSKGAEPHHGYIFILRDITREKSLEEERDEFISVVSHELRTPITITEGAISNVQLMMKRGNYDEEALRSAVDSAYEETIFLSKMINDLSTLSRAERGVMAETEKIDVKDLVHAMFNQYQQQAEEKGLTLDIDTSPKLGTVETSRLYLEELLQDFITNAIKYTLKGTVTITAHRKDNIITFAVKDSGIGISKTDQKKIFEKFFRAEDYRTRETSGTGLGLYVATKLAKKMNTTIKLTSRINHGSTFSFSLPASD